MGAGSLKVKRLYVYALADQMEGHRFTDDVAVCWASSTKEAVRKFRKAYSMASKENVREVTFGNDDIAVLTDY